MGDAAVNVEMDAAPQEEEKAGTSTFSRVARYTVGRLVALFLTVLVGVYLTILIANMGGYVDEIRRGAIREQVSVAIFADQSAEIRALSNEERNALIDERVVLRLLEIGRAHV